MTPVQAQTTRMAATANVASGATHVGRGGGGLATITAGLMMAGAGFGIAILSRRAFARMRFKPSSASFAATSSLDTDAGFATAAGLAARALLLGFVSRVSGAGFAAAVKSAASAG